MWLCTANLILYMSQPANPGPTTLRTNSGPTLLASVTSACATHILVQPPSGPMPVPAPRPIVIPPPRCRSISAAHTPLIPSKSFKFNLPHSLRILFNHFHFVSCCDPFPTLFMLVGITFDSRLYYAFIRPLCLTGQASTL